MGIDFLPEFTMIREYIRPRGYTLTYSYFNAAWIRSKTVDVDLVQVQVPNDYIRLSLSGSVFHGGRLALDCRTLPSYQIKLADPEMFEKFDLALENLTQLAMSVLGDKVLWNKWCNKEIS